MTSRSRDIFPLPLFNHAGSTRQAKLSKSVKQRLSKARSWVQWANEGICALNSLADPSPQQLAKADADFVGKHTSVPNGLAAGQSCSIDFEKANASQRSCLSHINFCYSHICGEHSGANFGTAALSALLSKAGVIQNPLIA